MKKTWGTKKLSALYQIGSSKRVLKSQWKTSGVPFYRGREVTRLAADGFVDNELFISEEHFAELSEKYGVPKAGDIVITAIGTIGNSHVVRSSDRFYFKDASVLWMKRTADVSSEFVSLWLTSSSFHDQLDRGSGATVDTLTIQKLQSVELCLPPLAEQQRIVGLLDDAFAGIATATASAEQNLRNARALFESHLQSVFVQRGHGWVEKNLGDICQIKTGKKDVNEGNPVGKYPFFTCAATHTFSDSYSFDTNAVLVAGNGNVGQVSYHSGKFEAYQRTYVLFDFKGVSAKYLFRVLDKRLSATVSKQKLGNTMPYIKIGMLRDFVVPVPPPKEQELVAESLSAIAKETQRLALLYERKLAALEALKKSLLQQAFKGEL